MSASTRLHNFRFDGQFIHQPGAGLLVIAGVYVEAGLAMPLFIGFNQAFVPRYNLTVRREPVF
jgi:hypothetical protein